MKLFPQKCEVIKAELKLNLNKKEATNVRFSYSMDEYTSNKNQHYLNINIHEHNQHFNLGLIRISRLYPAKGCLGYLIIISIHLVELREVSHMYSHRWGSCYEEKG